VAALDGVYQKIERARIHQVDLAQRLAAVLGDRQRFVLDDEPDPDTGRYNLRVYDVPAIGPEWLTIVGDCLHNLRSALDHLAWQLVILDGKKPNFNTNFPIRIEADTAKPLLRPEVCRQDILDAVEAVQPYADRGNPADSPLLNLLWPLHRLNIIDKHRLLVVVVHTLNLGETYWGWGGDNPAPTFYFHPVAVEEDGTVVASFDFHGHQPLAEFRPNAALHLVVNEKTLPNLTLDGVENFLDSVIFHVELKLTTVFGRLFPPGTTRPVTDQACQADLAVVVTWATGGQSLQAQPGLRLVGHGGLEGPHALGQVQATRSVPDSVDDQCEAGRGDDHGGRP
jgi:hypothetical protein